MRSAFWMLLVLLLVWLAVAAGVRAQGYQARRPAGFVARWVGQDGQDWTGRGPSVGPDGLQDVHIQLTRLAAGVAVKAVRVEGPTGARWESGMNPRLLANAEFVRDAKDPSAGAIYFQPDRDLNGERLSVRVAYDYDKLAAVPLTAGRCDPALRMPASRLPELPELAVEATWLGQDGAGPGSPGDVHVALAGLPTACTIAGAVLTDAVRGTWMYRPNDRVPIPPDLRAEPLWVKQSADGKSADLYFAPYRDESQETMALRLAVTDGRSMLVRFPGRGCDLGRRAARPGSNRTVARPGDDLHVLVEKFGTVELTAGTYRLSRSLVLNRPVTLTGDGNAILLFDQAATEPPWSAAIKIFAGNTTLNGLTVRFAGPVRWNNEISWGPAVIGMIDNTDPPRSQPRVNLAFTHLDLEIPPVGVTNRWIDAVRLMRLVGASNGVIADNVLRGGPIEFFRGPWRIVGNEFRGTLPGTFSHGVFAGHDPHDVLVKGNQARNAGRSGKTWRFLVLTSPGFNDVVEGNICEGLGALEGDTIPWSNEPEIILTEAYHVRYEGKVMDLSSDGRLARTGRPQSVAGRTGDVVSLLQGPAAGEWRRIVQAIDDVTYLVDRPIPAGTTAVSVSQGFIGTVFQDNRIDIRGGRKSGCLVFVGNHFGTRIINNHLMGGDSFFKLTACPSETPVMWGWTHAPFLGGVIEGNIFEDAEHGGTLGVEHDPRYVKSNRGRTYMTVRLDRNTVRWSEAYLKRMARAKSAPAGLTVGYANSNDSGELVVHAAGNQLEAARVDLSIPSLTIHAAQFNSRRVVNRRFRFPAAGSDSPRSAREAKARPAGDTR